MITFDPHTLHHAYIIEVQHLENRESIVEGILKDLGIQKEGNPDVHIQHFDTFGIDDARSFSFSSFQKGITGDKKLFIFSIGTITTQAQNALLKIVEDPVANTYIFILIPSVSSLLPTLLSRCQVVPSKFRENVPIGIFLKSSYKERLALVTKLVEGKDASSVKTFLNTLEKEVHEAWKNSKDNTALQQGLKEIVMAQKYCSDQGASYKFLLEHIALAMPRI